MNTHIRNGWVVDPASDTDEIRDIYIAAGTIVSLGDAPDGFVPDHTLDAEGLIVCPGLVDLRARLREPGQEHKGTIETETRAAAAAGITTLCCPPDTDPVIDTPAVKELIDTRAAEAGMARVEVLGAMTQGLAGTQLAEMGDLALAGVRGVSNGLADIPDTRILRHALNYANTFGLRVFAQPVEHWLSQQGIAHDGVVGVRNGLTELPASAEAIAISRYLLLVEEIGVPVHFAHLSSTRAVELIREAQGRRLPVTADVCVHHLHLTEMDIADYDANCYLYPPLRSQRDREQLRQAIADGTISVITSDHQPHEADAKLAPLALTEPGISGLETLLPLTLRLVADGLLDLGQAIDSITRRPAETLGLQAGRLAPGYPADICIFDPDERWEFRSETMSSRGHNSPYHGWEMQGRVKYTLFSGDPVYQHEEH